MSLVNIILYSLMIAFNIVGLFTAIFFLIMMIRHRSVVEHHKASYLVASISYIAYILSSPLFLEMSSRSIYGQLHPNKNFNGWFCRLKSYLLYLHMCVYFFSFFLQSVYRFCRIDHPKLVVLRSFRLYVVLSISLWFLAAILLAPSYFLGDIDYLPHDYHCRVSPMNLRGSLIISLLFFIPFILTLIGYFYTIYYIQTHNTTLDTIHHKRNMSRDLFISTRLIFIFVFITILALPHGIIPILHAITGYLPTWIISFEWLLIMISFTLASIVELFVTPDLYKLCFGKEHRKHMRHLSPT